MENKNNPEQAVGSSYGGPQGLQNPPGYYPAQYSTSPTITLTAPQPMTIVQVGDSVPDNTVISIISIFFCCILGTIATVKSQESKTHLRQGDLEQAQRDADLAKKLAIEAIINGIVFIALTAFLLLILPLIAFRIYAAVILTYSPYDINARS